MLCVFFALFSVLLCQAADFIDNGNFEDNLSHWSTTGSVEAFDGVAFLSDFASQSTLSQSTPISGGESYRFSFDFINLQLSDVADPGTFQDTVFATLYFADTLEGLDPVNGVFEESVAVMDIHFDGATNVHPDASVAPRSFGESWMRSEMTFSTDYRYAVPVFQLNDLNLTPEDSVFVVDNISVKIETIPEPSTVFLMFVGLAACGFFLRRRCWPVLCLLFFLQLPIQIWGENLPFDASDRVTITTTSESTTLNRNTNELVSEINVNIENTGDRLLIAPFHLVTTLTGTGDLSSVEIDDTLDGIDKGPYGAHYSDLTFSLPNGLAPTESVNVTLTLRRPVSVRVRYALQAFSFFNRDPVLSVSADSAAKVNETLLFDASGSSDPDDDDLTISWDFGDGTTSELSSLSHSFSRPGNYEIEVTASDPDGASDSKRFSVLILPEGSFAMARTRTLDGSGQPLGAVRIDETVGESTVNLLSQEDSGYASLGGMASTYTWKFTLDGYLSVWRRATLTEGDIAFVASPWLTEQSTVEHALSAVNDGELISDDASLTVRFDPGAFRESTTGKLTVLDGQSLPFPTPLGWSPLLAFHIELGLEPTELGTVSWSNDRSLSGLADATFAFFDIDNFQWVAHSIVTESGQPELTLDASGFWALLEIDEAFAGESGLTLDQEVPAQGSIPADASLYVAAGALNPAFNLASSIASEVTSTGSITIEHTETLPSGLLFRSEIDETYTLSDGSLLRSTPYDTTFFAYKNTGDSDSELTGTFPLRPRLLFSGEEVNDASITVDIFAIEEVQASIFDTSGGFTVTGDISIKADPNALTGFGVVETRTLEVEDFSSLSNGLSIAKAFQLSIPTLASGKRIDVSFDSQTPDVFFVLAKVISTGRTQGLQPVERMQSDGDGNVISIEPASRESLPGVTSSGQFVLVEVSLPQGIISGAASDITGTPADGLIVTIVDLPWMTISTNGGFYQLIAPEGNGIVQVTDTSDGNQALQTFEILDVDTPLSVDLETEETGPSVSTIEPADGETDVSTVTAISVLFSEPIDPVSFGADGVVLKDAEDNVVDASLSLNLAGTEAELLPTDPLENETTYTVIVSSNITDLTGLPFDGETSFAFTTIVSQTRAKGGQLITWEPGATDIPADILDQLVGFDPADDTTISVVQGTQGVADPEVPTIIVNETTGETATVLSNVDGSFVSFIRADVDDFISATFVNANGTRIRVPMSRQNFDDGGVALFNGGGILEAESDGGPVQVIIEPDAIAEKTKFKVDVLNLQQLFDFLEDALPEFGEPIAGIEIETEGDELTTPAEISIPFDPETLDLDPDMDPEDVTYLISEVIEIDGVKVNAIADTMEYEDGELSTNSPPFPGVFLNVQAKYFFQITGVPLPTLQIEGRVLEVYEDQVEGLNNGTINPESLPGLAGATVFTHAEQQINPGLTSGAFVARSDSNGYFVLKVPSDNLSSTSVTARSTRYPLGAATGVAQPKVGQPVAFTYLPFVKPSLTTENDNRAPIVTISQDSDILATNETVEIRVSAIDDASKPNIYSFDWIDEPNAEDGLYSFALNGEALTDDDITLSRGLSEDSGNTAIIDTFEFNVSKSAIVFFQVKVTDESGNTGEWLFKLRFGPRPDTPPDDLLPHDPDDETRPRVVSMLPADGRKVSLPEEIIIGFTEAVNDAVEEGDGILITGSKSGNIDFTVELADNQQSITINLSSVQPDEQVTVTLSSDIEDLNGNGLESFSGEFTTAPVDTVELTGIGQLLTTRVLGNLSFSLDHSLHENAAIGDAVADQPGLVIHRLGDGDQQEPIGAINLPDYPRALAVVEDYSYVVTPDDGEASRGDLVVAAGGILGSRGGQWMWIIDVSDPENPVRIASGILTVDIAAPVTIIKHDSGYLFTSFITLEGSAIYRINLQAFILGTNYTDEDWEVADYDPGYPGVDTNGDGDFVDDGETLPVPVISGLFGLDFSWAIADERNLYDFDVNNAGANVVGTLSTSGAEKPSRLQVIFFSGREVGLGDNNSGAHIFEDVEAFRVALLQNLVIVDGDTRDTVLTAAIVATENSLQIFDISSDPNSPALVNTITLPEEGGKIVALEELEHGRFGVTAKESYYLLDTEKMGVVENSGDEESANVHSSLIVSLPLKSSARNVAIDGINAVGKKSGGLKSMTLPPRISFVRFPTLDVMDRDVISAGLGSDDAITDLLALSTEETFILPAPIVPYGDDFPSAIDDPANAQFHYHILFEAPGELGTTTEFALEALDVYGERLNPKGNRFAPVMLSDRTFIFGLDDAQINTDPIIAYRLSEDKQSPHYNRYLSEPFVAVREALSEELQEQVQTLEGRQAIFAGAMLRATLEDAEEASSFEGLVSSSALDYLDGVSETVFGFCADFIDSANPSFINASPIVDGVFVQSGEFRHKVRDNTLEGYRNSLELYRTYESQSHYAGPFGRGWDFNFNTRICELPEAFLPEDFQLPLVYYGDDTNLIATPGDIILIDGESDAWLFRKFKDDSTFADLKSTFENDPAIEAYGWEGKIQSYYLPPPGRFDALFRFNDGAYVLIDTRGARTFYNAQGRLDRKVDVYESSQTRVKYLRDGRIEQVIGDRDIAMLFFYYLPSDSPDFRPGLDIASDNAAHKGLIAKVSIEKDATTYFYDDDGNLERVESDGPDALVYGYDSATPNQLTSIGTRDGTNFPAFKITYENGLVTEIQANGETTTFTGAAKTAEERKSGGTATLTAGDTEIEIDEGGRPSGTNGGQFDFDDQGRLTSADDGNVVSVFDEENPVYRFRGNLLEFTSNGLTSTIEYDGTTYNRMSKTINSDNVTTDYTYDGDHGPTTIEEIVGPVTRTLTFNADGVLSREEISEAGNTFTKDIIFVDGLPCGAKLGGYEIMSFDREDGNMKSVTRGGTDGFSAEYSSNGRIQELTGQGDVPSVNFDHNDTSGLLTNMSVSSGDATLSQEIGYSSVHFGRAESMTLDQGDDVPEVENTYEYDADGRIEHIHSNGKTMTITYKGPHIESFSGPGVSKSFTYTSEGLIDTLTENGVLLDFDYDGKNRLTEVVSGNTKWTYTYDTGKFVETRKLDDSVYGTLINETIDYDGAGRISGISGTNNLLFTYFPDGTIRQRFIDSVEVVQLSKNAAGLITNVSLYDGVMEETYAAFDLKSLMPQTKTTKLIDGTVIEESLTYTTQGRVKTRTINGVSSIFDYDDFGLLESESDPDEITVSYTNTPLGLPCSTTFSDGATVTYEFNDDLLIESVGGMSFEYNDDLQPTDIDFPDGTSLTLGDYNEHFLPETISSGGITQVLTYDQGRLSTVNIAATGDSKFLKYDCLDILREATVNGHTESYTYSLGGITMTKLEAPLGTWELHLGTLSKPDSEDYPSGLTLNYQTHDYGLVSEITELDISNVEWRDFSAIASLSYTNNITLQHEYREDGVLEKVIYRTGGEEGPIVAGFEYDLTSGGRLNSETRYHEDNAKDVYSRNTAEQGLRITGVEFSIPSDTPPVVSYKVEGIAFDANGDIDLSGITQSGIGSRNILSPSNALSNLNAQGSIASGSVWINAVASAEEVDAKFYYDGFGRINKVERLEDDEVVCTIQYERNANGNIIKRTVEGDPLKCETGEWRYFWQGNRLLERYRVIDDEAQIDARYIYLGARLAMVQVKEESSTELVKYIPLVNFTGSVCGYMNESGEVVEIINYGLYGLPEIQVGAIRQARSSIGGDLYFHGTFFDPEAGLYDMGERTLHPVYGEFLQRDSQLYIDSAALRLAFNGDPASRVDRLGASATAPEGTQSDGGFITKNFQAIKNSITKERVYAAVAGAVGLTSFDNAKLAVKFHEKLGIINDDQKGFIEGNLDLVEKGWGVFKGVREYTASVRTARLANMSFNNVMNYTQNSAIHSRPLTLERRVRLRLTASTNRRRAIQDMRMKRLGALNATTSFALEVMKSYSWNVYDAGEQNSSQFRIYNATDALDSMLGSYASIQNIHLLQKGSAIGDALKIKIGPKEFAPKAGTIFARALLYKTVIDAGFASGPRVLKFAWSMTDVHAGNWYAQKLEAFEENGGLWDLKWVAGAISDFGWMNDRLSGVGIGDKRAHYIVRFSDWDITDAIMDKVVDFVKSDEKDRALDDDSDDEVE